MTIPQGTQFGPYKILEQIGSGGMGEVYRALDTRLNREVAIKVVSNQFLAEAFGGDTAASGTPRTGSPSATPNTVSHRRFLREAQASSALNHPNICTIHDIGEQEGRPFLVMELLRGQTLKQLLRDGPLSVTEVVSFSRQAASALKAAHALGIVHRDIKPANIFVVGTPGFASDPNDKPQIKILDFGLAKQQDAANLADSGDATATFSGQPPGLQSPTPPNPDLTSPGSTMGTVAYMSPEQAEGQPLDARTDLFSLGSVMFEMATGHTPFAGSSPAGIFAALLTKDPPAVSTVRAQLARPPLPAGFDAIQSRLLQKDKTLRYQRAADVERDLDVLERGATGSFSAAPASPPAAAAPSNPKRNLIAALAVLLLLLAAAAFGWWKHKSATTTAWTAPTASPAPAVVKDSIIVANFINQTGDPVFDTTLNQALAAQLEQSPVLSLISPQHLRKSVTYLGKPEDTPITPELAREIGEREGIKAILNGTIASLGKAYVITLTAQNSATGDEIATTQATAPDKEHVLDAVNTAGAAMRGKLGESLASIQKLNAPFGQATTPSLEAFRLYALGDQAKLRGHEMPDAENYYKQALAIDPKLAMAWARLGSVYDNAFLWTKGDDAINRAYQLRDHVSERERRYINEIYLENNLGDFADAEPQLTETAQLYPLDEYTHIHLGNAYMYTGEFEKSIPEYEAALAIQPDDAVSLENLLWAYGSTDQLDKMRDTLAHINALGLNGTDILAAEVQAYGLLGDQKKIDALTAQVAGRPDEFLFLNNLGFVQFMQGHIQQSKATVTRGGLLAHQYNAPDAEAGFLTTADIMAWSTTGCSDMEAIAKKALALDHTRVTVNGTGLSLAFCGFKSGLPTLEEARRKYPTETLLNASWIPQAKAMLLLKDGNPKEALVELEKGRKYEQASAGAYMRGLAYLQLKDAQNAIAAFKDATRYRGAGFFAYWYPIPYAQSWLGMARAYSLAGDKANAKKAYEKFFAEWKTADPDIPDLIAAKKEYAAL
jgi:serine/threonine protein kinase